MADIINLTGLNEMTIPVEPDNVYKISYLTSRAVDIKNDTGGDIYVNSSGIFTDDESTGVGNYILIPEGDSYNGYRPELTVRTELFIKSKAAGKIGVVVKGY